jgi:hypothetical protein
VHCGFAFTRRSEVQTTRGDGFAYFAYSIPALSQAILIALLSLLWLSYLHRTVSRLRQP